MAKAPVQGNTLQNPRMLQALRAEPHAGIPVWFMRQAGRYLPGYRRVRSRTDFLTLCKTPDLAAEVTLEPLETFGMDAVIIFSDILVPLEAMGMGVAFTDAGPCMTKPIENRAEIEALRVPDPVRDTGFVMDVIRAVKKRVAGRVPVIGFAGAPFTLACYALEGSPSRTFARALGLVYRDPREMHLLLDKIARTIGAYLRAQVEAGADVIQLFDTWGGMLANDVFEEFSLGYARRILRELDGCGVPRILFIKGAGQHLPQLARSGAECLGVDHHTSIEHADTIVPGSIALQGNLAPEALLGPTDALIERARRLLDHCQYRRGYVFNLGHGILPQTPVDNVRALVQLAHSYPGTRQREPLPIEPSAL